MRLQMSGLAAALCLSALPAVAAPMSYIDESCRAQVVNQCIQANRAKFTSGGGGGFISVPTFDEHAARIFCADAAAGKCVATIDVPTTAEVKAIAAEANRLQQEQWAAWLRTLEETGVVRPNAAAPPPPAPRQRR